jgi:beta-glucosidase
LVDDQTAHELYLKAFEYPILEAVTASVMASYQGYQITPTQQVAQWATDNPMVLKTIVRDSWKFTGFIESDYDATHSVHALLSGLDQDSGPDKNYFADELKPLVDPSAKTYSADYARALDAAVARVLYQYERFGLLESPSGSSSHRQAPRPDIDLLRDQHAQITERLAEEAAVLLKNDNAALPLKPADMQSIAVIGPTARQVMIDGGQPERARGFPDRTSLNTLQMLKRLSPAEARYVYAPGIDWIGTEVPASAFGSGLVRTVSDAGEQRTVPAINYDAHSSENDLKPGVNYTWAGTLTVPSDDIYYFWIQRNWLDALFSRARSVMVTIDGANQTLVSPGVPVATYPAGVVPENGTNEGFPIKLDAGAHNITIKANIPKIGFYPIDQMSPVPVSTPVTFRLTWLRFSETLAAAVSAAKSSKTVLLFVDDNGLPEDETGVDRNNIVGSLAPNQDALIDAVTKANKNTIVVMSTGNPVLMPWIGKVKAVLETWYPGQEGATAIARLLLGVATPSGRTPITWPESESQTPFAGHPERIKGDGSVVHFSEGMFMGYRWYDQHQLTPLFPFGHGLSYTAFSYTSLRVAPKAGGLAVSFTIRNNGPVAGAEIPQVYLGPPAAVREIQVVLRKLVAFDRVELRPGQKRRLELLVSKRELSYWSAQKQNWILPAEPRDVYVGSSSRDVRLQTRSRTK